MVDNDNDIDSSSILLNQLSEFEASQEDKDDTIWYQLRYLREHDVADYIGKLIEVGDLHNCSHEDLRSLANDGYSHFGIFRLKEDRSTTTLVQDKEDNVYKVFSFSRSNVKVSHRVEISVLGQNNRS